MSAITVDLGNRSYSIHIQSGILSQSGEILRRLQLSRNVVIVSSKPILSLHGHKLSRSLNRSGFSVETLLIQDGERHKNLATVEKIYRRLSALRANRRTVIVAFGGGVVGDMAGFAAASYLRGLSYVQVPTTLLAQIDSAIGGKTGVNLSSGKNLVGAFHQPSAVIADPLLLSTLPSREFCSGLYEAIKYSVIRSQALFRLLDRKHSRLLHHEKASLEEMIVECARIKSDVVSRDETESELRMILNYGHTLGHAIESATKYERFTHGEAIAHGMILANLLAQQLKRLPSREAEHINDCIRRLSPLPSLRALRWNQIFRHMLTDKKFVDQRLRFVLPRHIGKVEIVQDVPPLAVEQVLRSYLHAQP
jgi:3-dehydroquinate synthase